MLQEAGKLVEGEGSPDSSLRSTIWLVLGFMTSEEMAEQLEEGKAVEVGAPVKVSGGKT